MKTIAPAAMAAIEAGEAVVGGAVDIVSRSGGSVTTGAFDPSAFDAGAFDVGGGTTETTIRVWGGYGVLTIAGHNYQPLGDKMLAQQTNGALGGTAQGYTLSLSGVEDEALKLLEPGEAKGASVVLYRLFFASDGKTLLDAHVFDRGHGDTITTAATVGGTARIDFAVESAARALGRRGGRRRSDSDQRLINPTDGYFKNVSYAAQKMLYWGGKRPANVGSTVSPPLGNFG